ncbi:MAG TPA: twin-arginine translocase subunit TatC, partial [Candidatus Thalassarchaeaceae archaeon]|nr:twin-arginine translocase subunit TatC [Candidatus Thalassarchaeaceae archaeon]
IWDLQNNSGIKVGTRSEGCNVSSVQHHFLSNERHSEDFRELHSIARKSALLFLIICIIWSFLANQVISLWIGSSSLPAGPNNENLSVFGPFDWIQIRWSVVMLLSIVSILPTLSIMTYNFAKPGLYHRERNWLTAVLIFTTTVVPVSILFIWAFGLPAIYDISISHGTPEGVLVRYDAAAVFSLGLGATWVLVVWSVTTVTLSLSRIFGMVYSGKTRFRNRMLAISTGVIILTLPVEYDGLKLVIAILTALSAEKLSQTAPVKMDLFEPYTNNDSTY